MLSNEKKWMTYQGQANLFVKHFIPLATTVLLPKFCAF